MKLNALLLFLVPITLVDCTDKGSKESIGIPEDIQKLDNLTVYSTNVVPAYEITLEQEDSFGDTEEVLLGPIIRQMVVDDIGRVYIADDHTKMIHVFNPDGSYLHSIGREGNGPGEFQMITAIRLNDDHLIVLDHTQSKVSIFYQNTFGHQKDINLSVDESKDDKPSWIDWANELRLSYRVINLYINSDRNYLVIFGNQTVGALDNLEGRTWEVSIFNPSEERYLEHDIISLKADMNAFTFDGGRLSSVPFKPKAHIDSNGQQMVYGWGENMLFKLYDTKGVYQRAFYYSRSGVELKLDELLAYYNDEFADHEELKDLVIRGLRSSELPQRMPVFHNLKVDDENRIWVSTIVDDQEVYEWWVLDEEGELLARLNWPRDKSIELVKNGYLYTRETDELELISIVRYRIELEERQSSGSIPRESL